MTYITVIYFIMEVHLDGLRAHVKSKYKRLLHKEFLLDFKDFVRFITLYKRKLTQGRLK